MKECGVKEQGTGGRKSRTIACKRSRSRLLANVPARHGARQGEIGAPRARELTEMCGVRPRPQPRSDLRAGEAARHTRLTTQNPTTLHSSLTAGSGRAGQKEYCHQQSHPRAILNQTRYTSRQTRRDLTCRKARCMRWRSDGRLHGRPGATQHGLEPKKCGGGMGGRLTEQGKRGKAGRVGRDGVGRGGEGPDRRSFRPVSSKGRGKQRQRSKTYSQVQLSLTLSSFFHLHVPPRSCFLRLCLRLRSHT